MKRNLIQMSMIILMVSAGLNHNFAGTAHSYAVGGLWNNESTWVENFIPGPDDTAYINGPVIIGSVLGYEIFHTYAGWVIVENTGHLYPHDYGGGLGIFILYIEHDIVNNGSVTNFSGMRNEELLNINVKGNITNNGYWRVYQTDLSGYGNQNLILEQGRAFGGWWTSTGPHLITALSNLWFDCRYSWEGVWYTGDFNLNGSTLFLGNHSIRSTGTLIYNGILEGNFEILGKFGVNKYVEDTLVFIGNITVTDTLESNEYGGGYGIQKLKIEGNIVNNGVVRDREDIDNPDDLNILITGNITNNGKWTCNYVNLTGTEPQHISQSPGTKFVSNFYDLDISGEIIADTDLEITKDIFLNGSRFDMQGHILTLSSWMYNGFLKNAILRGGYLQSVTATESLLIRGLVIIDQYNAFDCPVFVEDTLRSNYYGGGACLFDLPISGNLINHGVIENYDSNRMLRLYVSGNITNNGKWLNTITIFNGISDQEITQANGKYFGCDLESQKTDGNLVVKNDLNVTGSVNLNGSILHMEGHRLSLQQWIYDGYLDNAILEGGFIQTITATGNLIIEGTVTADDYNIFNCNVIVKDTLQSNTYGGGSKYYDVEIAGSLTNSGVIRSQGSGMLRLYISGDLVNAGEWNSYLTYVKITGQQYLQLIDNRPIGGIVQFEAVPGSGPYQWYYNNAILDSPDFEGETTKILTWNVPVTSEWYGSYYCETGPKEQVGITVKEGFLGLEENLFCKARIWSYGKLVNVELLETGSGQVTILDLTGKEIEKYIVTGGLSQKHLKEPGIYLVCLNFGNKMAYHKVVIR
jgi:hypothetical protein